LRQIPVHSALFSPITPQPFTEPDRVHRGKSRLIPVNPASKFFRLPKLSPPPRPSLPTRLTRSTAAAEARSGVERHRHPDSAGLPPQPEGGHGGSQQSGSLEWNDRANSALAGLPGGWPRRRPATEWSDIANPGFAGLPVGWPRRRPAITLDHTRSRWITVDNTSFLFRRQSSSGHSRSIPRHPAQRNEPIRATATCSGSCQIVPNRAKSCQIVLFASREGSHPPPAPLPPCTGGSTRS